MTNNNKQSLVKSKQSLARQSPGRQLKEEAVKGLLSELQEAKSLLLVDFAKMGMEAQIDLKKKLKESGAKMYVAKNTLLKIAITEAKFPSQLTEDSVLSGQTAMIIGSKDLNADGVAPIQAFGKFLETSEAGSFKAGFVDGNFADRDTLITISNLPTKEVLVSQTVGSIAHPLYSLVSNLQSGMQTLIGILSAKSS